MSFFTLRPHYLCRPKLLIIVLSLLISQFSAPAQNKNFSINRSTPSWIVPAGIKPERPKEKDISDGYFFSVFENQTHAEFQEEYTHIIKEIVSDAGVQNASQISVTYDPSFQKLIFHKILLKRGDRLSDQLAPGKFKILQNEKDLSKFIYSGTYDAFLLLEDVRKGDQIEFSYTIKGNNPIFGHKFASQYYFEWGSSVGALYMNLIADKKRNINIKSFNDAEQPKISTKGDYKIYEWKNNLTKTHRSVDFEPSWYNPAKRAQLTEYSSWNEVVNWGLSVNDYPNLKSHLLDQKVREFQQLAKGDKKKYIELATRFVQDQIRYMGIEMGVYSHRPNSPERVLKQRYGDCKDKSLLLVHFLRAQHIEAYMVYADTYSTIKTNAYLPSPFVFNHVVVAVDYDKRRTWIDPTMSNQRDSFDHFYMPDYGYVLVIKPGINALEKMSSNPEGQLVASLVFDIADTTGKRKSTLHIVSKYTGNYANNIRGDIAESGTDGTEKDYLEYYAKYYPDIETQKAIKIEDDETTNTISIFEYYEIDNIWVENDDASLPHVYFYGDLISSELRKVTGKKRKEPLSMKYPVNVSQLITVHMPYNGDYGSESLEIDHKNYHYNLDVKQNGKTETFEYTLKNKTAYLEGNEIKDYLKDYKKIDDHSSYYLTAADRNKTAPDDTNHLAVLIFMLTVIFSSFLFFKMGTRVNPFDLEQISQAKSIGGWLIIMAIGLLMNPISILYTPIQSHFYDQAFWSHLSAMGKIKGTMYMIAFSLDLVMIALLFTLGLCCTVLFFSRRDVFPKLFVWYSLGDICVSTYDFILTKLIYQAKPSTSTIWTDFFYLILSISFCTLWILYVKRSARVRETFVFTYPETAWTKAMIRYYNNKLTSAPAQSTEKAEEIFKHHENI